MRILFPQTREVTVDPQRIKDEVWRVEWTETKHLQVVSYLNTDYDYKIVIDTKRYLSHKSIYY